MGLWIWRDIIEEANAGRGCDLCSKDQFIKNTIELAQDEDLRTKIGQNARQLAVEKFNRDKLAAEVLEIINKVFHGDQD